jgi:DNA processing protein
MSEAEIDALLTLALTPGLGPTLTRRAMQVVGSAEAVCGMSAQSLAQIKGIGPARSHEIRTAIDALEGNGKLEQEKELLAEYDVTLLAFDDPGYPKLLRHIPDPPPLLYMRGELKDVDAVALAVVGSRRCSHYGREQTDRLTALCAAAGLCIVSGGAYGVDAAAHRAAMRVSGRTIAVVGSGLARPYPQRHAELFDEIAAGYGAVLSEVPMTWPPMAENFPRRNRIISGLALGVLVTEAAARSGALITARLAVEDHGREVMAVPGRVDVPTSVGCHKMIRQGWAKLVTNVGEILDALGETGELLKADLQEQPGAEPESLFNQNLTESQRKIIAALDEPRSLDQLVARSGLVVSVIQADLTMLSIRGLLVHERGMYASKASR